MTRLSICGGCRNARRLPVASANMEDLDRYLNEIVDPTVAEFEQHPASVRHAFITCVVVFHAVDYRAHPELSRGLRQKYRKKSEAFAIVDMVAHAFKHVQTERRDA